MLSLLAQKRVLVGRKVTSLRKQDLLPGVLYGPKIKNQALKVNEKDFEKIYKAAGESSLIDLKIGSENFQVLIHQTQRDSLSGRFLHVDFYQPLLTEETEAKVPLVFEGKASAVKELGGTLMKNISEIEVKALPQNLPQEIKVNLAKLRTFEDYILVEDLEIEEKVKILREPGEIIAQVLPPEKVEEELEKPIEEELEKVEKIGEETRTEEEVKGETEREKRGEKKK